MVRKYNFRGQGVPAIFTKDNDGPMNVRGRTGKSSFPHPVNEEQPIFKYRLSSVPNVWETIGHGENLNAQSKVNEGTDEPFLETDIILFRA